MLYIQVWTMDWGPELPAWYRHCDEHHQQHQPQLCREALGQRTHLGGAWYRQATKTCQEPQQRQWSSQQVKWSVNPYYQKVGLGKERRNKLHPFSKWQDLAWQLWNVANLVWIWRQHRHCLDSKLALSHDFEPRKYANIDAQLQGIQIQFIIFARQEFHQACGQVAKTILFEHSPVPFVAIQSIHTWTFVRTCFQLIELRSWSSEWARALDSTGLQRRRLSCFQAVTASLLQYILANVDWFIFILERCTDFVG